MKKLTIATPLYPPDIGGPATYTKLLEDALPKYGVEVEVVSFGKSRHLPKGISHLHFFWRVLRSVARTDVVLAQDPVSVGLPTMFAAKLKRKKFVIRMPGDYAWEQSVQRYQVSDTIDDFQTKRYGFRVELLRSVQVFVSKRADAIITPSDYFKRLVSGWGIDLEQISTVYNGIDLSQPPTYIEKPTEKTMVTAGRLVPWKGMPVLLKVLQQLPGWRLKIIGEGPQQSALEAMVAEQRLSDRVDFLGKLPRSDVLGWCKVADAFVLNTYFESFSFQIAEAMMAGSAIVTTKIGSLPELITNGEQGVLVEPDDISAIVDAVSSTVESPQLWQQRKDSAQEKAKAFTLENTVNSTLSVLHKVSHEPVT
ncbi:MAG: glycosyltransferase family 4 protein [Patescibacteria group bacterium]